MSTVLIVLLLFVASWIDIWYFIRVGLLFLFTLIQKRRKSIDELYKVWKLWGIVLPSDLDLNMHMNNSRYTRECDFARIHFWFASGMNNVFSKLRARIVVNAISVRFRRSLTLFQTYHISTQFIYWDDDALYFEHKIVTKDDFIAAIVYVKAAVRGATTRDVFAALGVENPQRQYPAPPEIAAWMESISLSSKKLRNKS